MEIFQLQKCQYEYWQKFQCKHGIFFLSTETNEAVWFLTEKKSKIEKV